MITWETNFGGQLATLCNEPIPTNLPKGEQPGTAEGNSSDAHENETDYIITTGSPNDVNDAPQSQNEKWIVTSAIEKKLLKLIEMKTLIGRIRQFTTKIWKNLCRICPKDRKKMYIFQREVLFKKTNDKTLKKGGIILSCSKNCKMMI